MKFFIALISSLLFFFVSDLDWLRSHFQEAHKNKGNATNFYKKAESIMSNQVAVLGYKAASKMLESKYDKNKELKRELFKQGATDLNELIIANPKNVEIRFIRLAIQQNTPSFLKYNSDITSDKTFIFTNYKSQDVQLQNLIKDYVLASNKFTESEKKSLL